LLKGTAVGRNRPELHDSGIVFHQEGNLGTIGRTAEPMTRTLDAGEAAVSSEGEPPLMGAGWRIRSALSGAAERAIPWLR
jgi:hypothetical protein